MDVDQGRDVLEHEDHTQPQVIEDSQVWETT